MAFAKKQGIDFPLLSDCDSSVFRRFGILNSNIAPVTASASLCGNFSSHTVAPARSPLTESKLWNGRNACHA